jgi:hypothetical protein
MTCLRRPLRIVRALFRHLPLAIVEAAEEAALVTFVADPRSQRFHLHQHRIAIAIGRDLLHHQPVPGAFALEPQLAPRAAIEGGEAGLHRLAEGLFVHVADHQNAARGVVLNDGGDEAVRFLKIQIHVLQ